MRIEADFKTALFDPAVMPPAGLSDPAGRPAGKRFDIYRNNVVVSLTEALEVACDETVLNGPVGAIGIDVPAATDDTE